MRAGGTDIIIDHMMGILTNTKLFSILFGIIIMHILAKEQLVAQMK
jgi:hypothetical protein